ncbi:hypothetical protein [Actinomadura sp. CNU-125]|uniref:hypothetical protein n=1 Tax=Actinomadura sp. CNU-125 TaxID=1904961 RepID=UPI0021CC545D|nr:hypothetical protein [Actinomadura sp. CNU-125]
MALVHPEPRPAREPGRLRRREGAPLPRGHRLHHRARDEVLAFAELSLRLLDLHRPQESGGITSDPDRPIRRCRACMARWPCATVRTMTEGLET